MLNKSKTNSKFKFHKEFRYLEGQISKSANDIDLKVYNFHRLRVSGILRLNFKSWFFSN